MDLRAPAARPLRARRPMTTKFPIAPAEEADGVPEWRELVTKATLDVSAAQGKTHSSDEGLA
jgi:hypothetical protein